MVVGCPYCLTQLGLFEDANLHILHRLRDLVTPKSIWSIKKHLTSFHFDNTKSEEKKLLHFEAAI